MHSQGANIDAQAPGGRLLGNRETRRAFYWPSLIDQGQQRAGREYRTVGRGGGLTAWAALLQGQSRMLPRAYNGAANRGDIR